MSIFPSETLSDLITATTTAVAPPLALAKEYAWDYTKNDFLLVDGKNVIVTGRDAVKVWVWKALSTPKNVYQAYPTFGNEIDTLIAQGLSSAALQTEITRYIQEALTPNPYITGISGVSIAVDGSQTTIEFTANTIYGGVEIGL